MAASRIDLTNIGIGTNLDHLEQFFPLDDLNISGIQACPIDTAPCLSMDKWIMRICFNHHSNVNEMPMETYVGSWSKPWVRISTGSLFLYLLFIFSIIHILVALMILQCLKVSSTITTVTNQSNGCRCLILGQCLNSGLNFATAATGFCLIHVGNFVCFGWGICLCHCLGWRDWWLIHDFSLEHDVAAKLPWCSGVYSDMTILVQDAKGCQSIDHCSLVRYTVVGWETMDDNVFSFCDATRL